MLRRQILMRNIFILYMPLGNMEAMIHYEDTIRKRVSAGRIYDHVDSTLRRRLETIFQGKAIAVWGSRDSAQNRAKFEKMREGDEILIVEGHTIRLLGRVAARTVSAPLARELWKNLRGDDPRPWELIYFIANPRELNLPFAEFCKLIGWAPGLQLRGFTTVGQERLEGFYLKYDDLFSVLCRIRDNQPVEKRPAPTLVQEDSPGLATETSADDERSEEPNISEHSRIQHLLLQMGRLAGEKVWAPRGDQRRLTAQYKFEDFETTFAAGLDTQVKYVENIDVVWKDEFRIDAAFEVENSTSIYSGLLRFADLTMVAPNTLYPMFIVAPAEKRHRVREQLSRPTFKHLRLAEKVHYLSYERIEEIDAFFGKNGSGISVEVFKGKAERLVG